MEKMKSVNILRVARFILTPLYNFRMLSSVLSLVVCLGGSLALPQPAPEVQIGATWPPDIEPGENCLPYDGSQVPDCTEFIDPDHYIPYYHEHSQSELSIPPSTPTLVRLQQVLGVRPCRRDLPLRVCFLSLPGLGSRGLRLPVRGQGWLAVGQYF